MSFAVCQFCFQVLLSRFFVISFQVSVLAFLRVFIYII